MPYDDLPTVAAKPHRSLWAAALVGHAEALSMLASRCAPAVYAWWRAQGSDPAEATARTGSYFAYLQAIEPPNPQEEDVERLQGFLLRRLTAFVAAGIPEADPTVPRPGFEQAQTERRFAREKAKDPEDIFHHRWALSALELTMETLREEYLNERKGALFALLPQFLSFSGTEERYEEVGKLVEMSSSGLRVAVYKFRQRYREVLRQIVGDTVRNEEAVDSELTKLLVSAS